MSEIEDSLLNLIGNTPIIKLESFDTGKCDLFVKLENHNPGGSIKDNEIIEAANDLNLIMILTKERHFYH